MLAILLVIVAVIAALLIFAASRPNTFSLVRSADFSAPPERVFGQLNDYKNWAAWSPWEEMDPTMQRSFTGAAAGKGAKYARAAKLDDEGDAHVHEYGQHGGQRF